MWTQEKKPAPGPVRSEVDVEAKERALAYLAYEARGLVDAGYAVPVLDLPDRDEDVTVNVKKIDMVSGRWSVHWWVTVSVSGMLQASKLKTFDLPGEPGAFVAEVYDTARSVLNKVLAEVKLLRDGLPVPSVEGTAAIAAKLERMVR